MLKMDELALQKKSQVGILAMFVFIYIITSGNIYI